MSNTCTPARHPLLAGIAVAGEGLDAAAAANVWSLADADLAGALDEVQALEGRFTAVNWRWWPTPTAAGSAGCKRRPQRGGCGGGCGWPRGRRSGR